MDGIAPTDTWGSEDIWAGVSYDTSSLKWEFFDESFNYKQLKNKGIEIQIDGKPLPDTVVCLLYTSVRTILFLGLTGIVWKNTRKSTILHVT